MRLSFCLNNTPNSKSRLSTRLPLLLGGRSFLKLSSPFPFLPSTNQSDSNALYLFCISSYSPSAKNQFHLYSQFSFFYVWFSEKLASLKLLLAENTRMITH